ncbi:23S rRNA (guanine(745)-N(1))-methyltransferase [Psychromonas antarctica]|jgi:23S rRNA (guanine745-N1)-methyltransferase|uniref:23S rRNA (guanine(745)-N(1))-methyltransferase n=1 Tax=Psychromonas antarctica TaxID=67573 RepID=UPI001EE8A80F|nr:23S rRNA (guanine(745)-N(1))-methyltransferase [Psychromonas antarctica]MCG6201438.1 23S rRNA (guanine(745)-N(1))-methyltransferase [Psychromonas antarctica]
MTPFICPLCQTDFQKNNNTQVCANNHHFDIAKEGYLNLLPVNAKNSKNPGDNKEMMTARRAFLNSGGYFQLAKKVSELVSSYLASKEQAEILDLGCGEGYYTALLAEQLPTQFVVNGLDISKVAIRYAAKRYKNINFCVASAYDVPLPDNSIDALIRIYAPSLDNELARLIKASGYLITVTPAPRHLFQLRENIYQQVNEHAQKNLAPAGFDKIEQINLNYLLTIDDAASVENLVKMTPLYWKYSEQKMQSLLAQRQWNIECDFNIEIYQRQEN